MKLLDLLAAVALVPVFAGGCDSSDKKGADRPAAGVDTDAAPATATVFLRGRADGDNVDVDIVARGASREVHGAAFRLRWAPDRLAFVDARASSAWSGSAIRLAKEGLPGELVVVWSEKGEATGLHASDETVLGTIGFTVKTGGPWDIGFRPERSTLRDATGVPIRVEWRGWQDAAP
jgi:hypothetical protein